MREGPVSLGDDDQKRVATLLDTLDGTFKPEITPVLPLDLNSIDILVGIIDLLVITLVKIQIIDYKTDHTRHAVIEYRKQPSIVAAE